MTNDAIDALIADLRRTHPELLQPLTWETMTVILAREGITLLRLPLAHDAQVISNDGVSIIAINSNSSPRRHTYYAAHEWAHVHLHFKEKGEVVYHTSACWPDDPREDDAEYMATMLLLGPRAGAIVKRSTVRRKDVGDGRPIVQRVRARPAPPPQPSLPLPPDPPLPYGQFPLPKREDDALMSLVRRNSPRLSARLAARDRVDRAKREAALDIRPRVEFTIEGRNRKHYFVDRDGTRWRVYDLLPSRKSAKSTAVEPPHNWASERVFVGEDGTRRRYAFKYRETRELEAARLESQLAAAST